MRNRNVLITGASGGIGYEFAKKFAKEKYNLILVARNKERLEDIRKELGHGIEVTLINKDLSLPNAAAEIYNELKSRNKEVDILINNAGCGLQGYFDELTQQAQLNMLQVNIVALTELTHLCTQDMIKNQYGRILNVGSISSFLATPSMSVYGAIKSYVLFFSEALNSELKRKGDISVTAFCPGPTITNFVRAANMDSLEIIFNKIGMSATKVAQLGYKSLINKKVIVIPGKRYSFSMMAIRFLPRRLLQAIISNITLSDVK